MKNSTKIIMTLLCLLSGVASASPLVNQWVGTGADSDKFFCEYGDGQVKVIYATQNCPLSN